MLEWLTPAERRGAAIVVVLLLLGAANDLWRARRPPGLGGPIAGVENAPPLPAATAMPPAATPDSALIQPATGRLDLNRASAAELEALPGIGPVLATRIVAHRVAHGPFQRIEDLLAVRGVGPRLFTRLRPQLAVQSAVLPQDRRADSTSEGRPRSR